MAGPFVEQFRNAVEPLFGRRFTEEDGISETDIDAVQERNRYELPEALRDFYTVLGAFEPVTSVHNRFYHPGNFERRDGKLVFCEENQVVVYWGYDADQDWATDPPVYQGVNGKTVKWYVENDRCSKFLLETIYWQALNGGLPETSFGTGSESLFEAAIAWPLVVREEDAEIFSLGSAVFSLIRQDTEVDVQAAGLHRSDLENVAQLLGVRLHGV
jgi:hypothetical protein